jgi:hypothetical protein
MSKTVSSGKVSKAVENRREFNEEPILEAQQMAIMCTRELMQRSFGS